MLNLTRTTHALQSSLHHHVLNTTRVWKIYDLLMFVVSLHPPYFLFLHHLINKGSYHSIMMSTCKYPVFQSRLSY